jgi:hypothetical protein
MKRIMIIDGLGGGIGVQLIERLMEGLNKTDNKADKNSAEIIALGTNAVATERMLKAGAQRGATGENALRVSAARADIIAGPIGIVIPDAMMGEITADIARAVLASPAHRVLLHLQNEHFILAGLEQLPLTKIIDKAIDQILALLL